MGARPEQQLALNFLAAVHDLWVQHPGTYEVTQSTNDLVPALAQMCIKSLAADVRDSREPAAAAAQNTVINGQLSERGGVISGARTGRPLNLRDALNKIIHGTPSAVIVHNGIVELHFTNNSDSERWTEAWFSGTQLVEVLGNALIKHPGAAERERKVAKLLEELGEKRFLPSIKKRS